MTTGANVGDNNMTKDEIIAKLREPIGALKAAYEQRLRTREQAYEDYRIKLSAAVKDLKLQYWEIEARYKDGKRRIKAGQREWYTLKGELYRSHGIDWPAVSPVSPENISAKA